jgi:hypothetical protein
MFLRNDASQVEIRVILLSREMESLNCTALSLDFGEPSRALDGLASEV